MENRGHRGRHRQGEGHRAWLRAGEHINFLTDVNGTLFFSAGDTTHGVELEMDGTDAGR